MPDCEVIWVHGPGGNVEHVGEHGLTTCEVEEVLLDPLDRSTSESSGRPIVFGYTSSGRFVAVVFEIVDSITVYPITAYEIEA